MYKYAAVALVGIFALVLGYGAYRMVTDPREAKVETPETVATTTISVRTETQSEDTADYSIDVSYPQFGIAPLDTAIRAAVANAARDIKNQAATDRPAAEGFRKYELFGSVDRTHVGREISATIILAQDFGGAHPLPIALTFNYTREGAEITLTDALALIGKTLAEVSTESKAQLAAKLGDNVIAPEGADAEASNFETFEISDSAVTFIFQPYQVAPYAAGMPEVQFSRQN